MKTNIVLIGMTGSGKSTIGKLLGKELAFSFVDMDAYIEETNETTIPELFAISEDHFRNLETKASKEIASQVDYTVISCGGGVILREENMDALKQTGWIFFIDRPTEQIIEDIKTDHRPLLKEGREKLYQLAEERMDLYHKSADFIVKNDSSLRSTLDTILSILKRQNIQAKE